MKRSLWTVPIAECADTPPPGSCSTTTWMASSQPMMKPLMVQLRPKTVELNLPKLTTLVQPFEAMAHLAVSTLIALLDGEDVPLQQLVEPILRIGETTR